MKTATEAIKGTYIYFNGQFFFFNIIIIFFKKIEYSENVYKLIESTTETIDPNLNVKLQNLEDKKNKIYTKTYDDARKFR